MKAIDERWPFVPEVRLYHDGEKCARHLRRSGTEPEIMDDGAQTWYHEGSAVVLLSWSGDVAEEHALLAHEAVHVALRHFDYLGEEHPNEEFVAYGVQVVTWALIRAHDRWRSRHGD